MGVCHHANLRLFVTRIGRVSNSFGDGSPSRDDCSDVWPEGTAAVAAGPLCPMEMAPQWRSHRAAGGQGAAALPALAQTRSELTQAVQCLPRDGWHHLQPRAAAQQPSEQTRLCSRPRSACGLPAPQSPLQRPPAPGGFWPSPIPAFPPSPLPCSAPVTPTIPEGHASTQHPRGWIHPRTTLRPPEAPASHLPAVSRRDQPWRRPGPAVLVPSWQGVAMTTSCLLRSPPAPGARRCGAQGPTTRPPPVPLQPCGDVGLAPNALCHAGRATGYHEPQAFSLACSCRLRCLLCPREHPSPGPPVAQALCPLVPLLLQRCHTAGVHCSCLPALPRIVLLGFSHAPEPPVTNRAS